MTDNEALKVRYLDTNKRLQTLQAYYCRLSLYTKRLELAGEEVAARFYMPGQFDICDDRFLELMQQACEGLDQVLNAGDKKHKYTLDTHRKVNADLLRLQELKNLGYTVYEQ